MKSHNHLPDFGHVKALKLVAKAKKRYLDEPFVIPAVVTQDTFSNADSETLVALPKENSVKTALRRVRKRNNPQLPASLDEMVNIPEEYRTIGGEL